MAAILSELQKNDIFMWKNPAKTGIALGAYIMFFVMFWWFDFAVTSFLCYFAILVIFLGGAASQLLPDLSETKVAPDQDQITKAVSAVFGGSSGIITSSRDIALWKYKDDANNTIMAIIALVMTRRIIGLLFSVVSPSRFVGASVFLGGLSLFVAPYTLEGDSAAKIFQKVDEFVAVAKPKWDQLLAKVPRFDPEKAGKKEQ
jgi:hypothetical protein